MMIRNPLLAALLGLALITPAFARMEGQTRRDKQLFACADDLQRLCPGPMSDSKKLKRCIRPKHDIVSAQCRAWLDVPE